MKRVFFYFSLSGNGDLVAKKLEEKGFEIRKVEPKKPFPKVFFFQIMKGGFLAGVKGKTPLKVYDPSLEGYDEIIIGSPIWNGRISSPVNTLLRDLDLSAKKVRFLLWAGGGEAKPAMKRLAKEFPGADVLILKQPNKYPEELEKLSDFA